MTTTLILIIVLIAVLLFVFFYYVYSSVPSEPKLSSAIHKDGFEHADQFRNYLTYIPVEVSKEPALVIALHGTGMNAAKMRQWTGYEFDELADRYGFITVYPEGYKGNWNDIRTKTPFAAKLENIDDVGFISTLVDTFVKKYNVHPAKVFVFGFSNGGQMAMRIAMEKPELLASLAAVSANLPTPETCLTAFSGTTPNIMLIIGTKDTINPYNGGEVSLFGFQKVGWCRSALETAQSIVQSNGITTSSETKILPYQTLSDTTSIEVTSWQELGKPRIKLYSVIGGGHVIPQQKFVFPRIMGKTTKKLDSPLEAAVFFGLTNPVK